MSKTILITGGTGFIGTHLSKALIALGYKVSILTRKEKVNTDQISYYRWDLEKQYVDPIAVKHADMIIHLAGEGIADKRWTAQRKKVLIESRTMPLEILKKELIKQDKKIDALISASAVGFYGAITTDQICNEDSLPYDDFLSHVCQQWENAADNFVHLATRIVKIRTGIVLGLNGGFLKKVAPPFHYGFGTILGSGKQFVPWIHIDDLINIYLNAIINNEMIGTYNAAVLDHSNFEAMAHCIAMHYNKRIWIPKIPSKYLKIILGEMSVAVTEGQRTADSKIKSTGFSFSQTNLAEAIKKSL